MIGITAQINDNDFLYKSPDGREAMILMNARDGFAFICTDIHGNPGRPETAVAFSADMLRWIADRVDELETGARTGRND